MNNFGYIYQIINIQNGKSYIGYTKDLFCRMKKYFNNFNKIENLKIKNNKLCRAFRKYGIDNFIVKILEQPNIKDLGSREEYYIQLFNTYKTGYNSTKGNDGGDTFTFNTKEQKQKIRQRMSEIRKGVPKSIQTRRNMSLAQAGHFGYTKGQKRSQQFKDNCSKRMLNNKVAVINISSDSIIELRLQGNFITDIAKQLHCSYGYVYKILKNNDMATKFIRNNKVALFEKANIF